MSAPFIIFFQCDCRSHNLVLVLLFKTDQTLRLASNTCTLTASAASLQPALRPARQRSTALAPQVLPTGADTKHPSQMFLLFHFLFRVTFFLAASSCALSSYLLALSQLSSRALSSFHLSFPEKWDQSVWFLESQARGKMAFVNYTLYYFTQSRC